MQARPSVAALVRHHAELAVMHDVALEMCQLDGMPMVLHPRCISCTVLLGPSHVENVPDGWTPGDRRPIECDYCWWSRQRRRRHAS